MSPNHLLSPEVQKLEKFLEPYWLLLPSLVDGIFRRYAKRHYSHMDVEDICQDIYVSLRKTDYQALRSFRHECKFETWLYQRAIWSIAHHWRKQKREVPLEEEALDLPSDEPGAEEKLIAESNHRAQFAAIQALPEEERRLIELRDCQGLNAKKIAELVGLQHQTVRKKLCDIRKKLQ